MPEDKFYEGRAWELLTQRLESIESKQDTMAIDISAIKNKMAWVFGMAAGITFIFNVAMSSGEFINWDCFGY